MVYNHILITALRRMVSMTENEILDKIADAGITEQEGVGGNCFTMAIALQQLLYQMARLLLLPINTFMKTQIKE
jgi:Na+-translocating ferredoxin:NAD+ oxidoreductase RnfC subunit